MTRTLILAVDPGKSGALAFLNHTKNELVEVCDMPTRQGEKDTKKTLDIYVLSHLVDRHASQIRYAVIEDVHSMPHDGVVSAFSFGKSTGIVIGVIASFNIPIYFVNPAVWKRAMGVSYEKDTSRAMASKLFIDSAHLFIKKRDDGRAEACLLAHFGKRFWL